MIRNYLKIAWRNLIKNKAHSFINITGLAIGMAIAMLIGLWIWDEVSYDKYHLNYESVGQVMTTQTSNGKTETFPSTGVPFSNELGSKNEGDFKGVALTWKITNILALGDRKYPKTECRPSPICRQYCRS